MLMGLGAVGGFFGSLFKGAISGERELLADAEAVQFTRNPDGAPGRVQEDRRARRRRRDQEPGARRDEQFVSSNFLFVEPSDALGRNPFLLERIRALEPDFDGCFPTTAANPP